MECEADVSSEEVDVVLVGGGGDHAFLELLPVPLARRLADVLLPMKQRRKTDPDGSEQGEEEAPVLNDRFVTLADEGLEGNSLVADPSNEVKVLRRVRVVAVAVQNAVEEREVGEGLRQRAGNEGLALENGIEKGGRGPDVHEAASRAGLSSQLLLALRVNCLEGQNGFLHGSRGRHIGHAHEHGGNVDKVLEKRLREERHLRSADDHQVRENLRKLAVQQRPGDEAQVGREEVRLSPDTLARLADVGEEQRAVVPVDVVRVRFCALLEQRGGWHADHREENGKHLLRQIRFLLSVGQQDVEVAVQTVQVSREDEEARPRPHDREESEIGHVSRGVQVLQLRSGEGLGLHEQGVENELEIQNRLLLPETVVVEIQQTRQRRALEKTAVARLHASVEKHLDSVAEDHISGNTDDQFQDQFQARGSQGVIWIICNTQNGENDRAGNQVGESLLLTTTTQHNLDQPGQQCERSVSFVWELFRSLKRHDDEYVQFKGEHQLRILLIGAEILDKAEGCME